jgi:hypothetical protein
MASGWRKEVISSPGNNCRLMAADAEKSCSGDPVDRINDQKQFSDQWPAGGKILLR